MGLGHAFPMAVSSYVQLPCCVKKQISLELASALALTAFSPHLLQWSLSLGGVRVGCDSPPRVTTL